MGYPISFQEAARLAAIAGQQKAEALLCDAVKSVLDPDLAQSVAGLPPERRTTDERLLAVQFLRLMRQLLEKLDHRDQGSQERRNG